MMHPFNCHYGMRVLKLYLILLNKLLGSNMFTKSFLTLCPVTADANIIIVDLKIRLSLNKL